MATDSLDRPGDKPAPQEETAIKRMNAEQQRLLDQHAEALRRVEFRLHNATQRKKAYAAKGDVVGVATEQAAIDRSLDERLGLMAVKR